MKMKIMYWKPWKTILVGKHKKNKIKRMLIEVMAIRENLVKIFFKSNLKKKNNIAFPYTSKFRVKMWQMTHRFAFYIT
jgi:hypothetical protein